MFVHFKLGKPLETVPYSNARSRNAVVDDPTQFETIFPWDFFTNKRNQRAKLNLNWLNSGI